MKKPPVILQIFSAVIAVTWIVIIYNHNLEKKKLNNYIQQANKYFAKEIYIDAAGYYNKAWELAPNNISFTNKYAKTLLELGETKKFIKFCEEIIKNDKKNVDGYILLANFYSEKKDIKNAIVTLQRGEKIISNAKLEKKLKDLEKQYLKLNGFYTEIGSWHNGYLRVKTNNGWELVDERGQLVLKTEFLEMGIYDPVEGVMPVATNDELYYIDIHGHRKLVGDYKYTSLSSFNEGVAPAIYKDKAGFINRDFQHFAFKYEEVSGMKNKVAAVKNKDAKWAIIDNKFHNITDFIYDDVILNENNFCSVAGVIFVKQGQKYFLIDLKGNKVGNEKFSAACAFLTEEPAAVEQDGQWGFVNTKGKVIIKPMYDNAQSFLHNKALVYKNELWGYIDNRNEWFIEPTFFAAKNFSSYGVAPVQISNGTWQLIQLYSYY